MGNDTMTGMLSIINLLSLPRNLESSLFLAQGSFYIFIPSPLCIKMSLDQCPVDMYRLRTDTWSLTVNITCTCGQTLTIDVCVANTAFYES